MQRSTSTTPSTTGRRAATWIVVAAIGCSTAMVEAQRVQADETFEDEVSVLEVETAVQVFVDGTPVRGLTSDDFRVVYQDRELDIVSFEAVDLSLQSGGADPGEASAQVVEQVTVPRSILMLFDFQYTPRGLMARSIDAANRMVAEQLHPSDRIAVAVMGGRKGAQLLTGFTRDRARTRVALDLVDAIADAKGRRQRELVADLVASAPATDQALAAEYGVAASVAFGEGLQDVTISANPSVTVDAEVDLAGVADSGNPLAAGAAEVFAIGQRLANYDNYRLAEQYAEAFGNLGTLLSGIGGQKYALLFSQGPPLSVLEMTTVSSAGGDSAAELTNTGVAEGSAMVQEAFSDAFGQLVRAGWQIHAVSQGLRPAAIPGGSGSIDDYGGGPGIDAVQVAGRNDGGGLAFLMADETGGRAYLNRGFPPVEEFLQQTAVSYVLRFVVEGFEPGGVAKERYRVELSDTARASGASLDYRDFFYPPKSRRRMNQVEQRIADAENRLREQAERANRNLEFTALSFTDPQDPGTAWLAVHFPASQLRRSALAARLGEGDTARLEVVASLGVDPQTGFDRVALNQSLTVPALGMNNPPPDGMTFVGRLDPGNGFIEGGEVVRVAVELGVTGARLRLRLQDWAPSADATGVVGPFFLPAGLERLVLRDRSEGNPVELPLRAPNGAELVPMPFAEVEADEQLGVMFWSQDDGGSVLGPETDAFAARAVPLAGDGAATAVRVERRGQIGVNVLWYTSLSPSGLAPGVYRIEADGFDNENVGYFRVLEP